jgi:hypothetical protein
MCVLLAAEHGDIEAAVPEAAMIIAGLHLGAAGEKQRAFARGLWVDATAPRY